MKQFPKELKINQITSRLPGQEVIRDKKVILNNVAELDEANAHSVCFFENKKFLDALKKSKAGLVLVPPSFDISQKPNTNLILTDKPYVKFMMLVKTWQQLNAPQQTAYQASSASVSNSAKLGKNVWIGQNVVIAAEVEIGSNCKIEANSFIGKNSRLGKNCHLFPNVNLYENTILKDNVIIHSGCVIGADGFGYLFHEGKQQKIPQVGNVVIHSDVEIGANTTIDRSTIGSTVIGEGTKIDNLVQIGHNCKIGKYSIICAQVGLAGSTEIGDRVYLAGQVGVAGHLKIHDGAMIGAQSGISKDVPENAKYFGTPAIDAGLQKRICIAQRQLPKLLKKIKKIKVEK
ncbi:MAG: UDP-3-O-[3-hydroxymyristoyl] glucosamine N-acyltransferase [Candidatus Cloacimonadota bacterium]|jgi:UDP-3-O-[3-hydroxymyristoyl] glucosamine N-acyltransferase|nr:UDP-3-O-[3-hydroxymyristoyl] glucosamine N-acyltransferase [Candidatus Cloacimonadota bacterium]